MAVSLVLDRCIYGAIFSGFVNFWSNSCFCVGVSSPAAPGFPCRKTVLKRYSESLHVSINLHALKLIRTEGIFWNSIMQCCFFTFVFCNSLTGRPGWPWTPFGPFSPWTPFSPCKNEPWTSFSDGYPNSKDNKSLTFFPSWPCYETVIIIVLGKLSSKCCLSTKKAEQHTRSPGTPCCPGRPRGPLSPCNNQLINKLQSAKIIWKYNLNTTYCLPFLTSLTFTPQHTRIPLK